MFARQYSPALCACRDNLTSIISCCTWSQAFESTIKPIIWLYDQTIKIMDNKEHCHILKKYNMFSFKSFMNYFNPKLIFKCLYGHAPSLRNEFVGRHQHTSRVNIQASTQGKCCIALHKTFLHFTSMDRQVNETNPSLITGSMQPTCAQPWWLKLLPACPLLIHVCSGEALTDQKLRRKWNTEQI